MLIHCRHCRAPMNERKPRRLCHRCRRVDSIRILYSPPPADPTDAELDALIAFQSRPENLPKWWAEDIKREQQQSHAEALVWLLRKRRF